MGRNNANKIFVLQNNSLPIKLRSKFKLVSIEFNFVLTPVARNATIVVSWFLFPVEADSDEN